VDSDTVVAFDLDGTLTDSKCDLDGEMAELLTQLTSMYRVAIITGGTLEQILQQVISKLPKETYSSVKLFPTSGSVYSKFIKNSWVVEIADAFTKEDKDRIMSAIMLALVELKIKKPKVIYGAQIEDRKTQITFSALGQQAPLELKLKYDPDRKIRGNIVERLRLLLPDFEIKIGGSTSIDVNRRGIDKAYGIKKICDVLNVTEDRVVFVGDAFYPGGNDSAVLSTDAKCYEVVDINETKEFIRRLLNHEL